MRYLTAIFLAGVVLVGARPAASPAPAWLDVPVKGAFMVADPTVRSVCGVWRTIEQIARRTQVRVGLQNSAECAPGGAGLDPGDGAVDLQGSSPRAAFDRLVTLRPEFSWREIDDVVVIRPAATWNAPADPLNRPVAPFHSRNVHPHYALRTILQSMQPGVFVDHVDVQLSSLGRRQFDPSAQGIIDRPISVPFRGGTMMSALNAVTAPFDGIWQTGYSGAFMHINVGTLDFQDGRMQIPARLVP